MSPPLVYFCNPIITDRFTCVNQYGQKNRLPGDIGERTVRLHERRKGVPAHFCAGTPFSDERKPLRRTRRRAVMCLNMRVSFLPPLPQEKADGDAGLHQNGIAGDGFSAEAEAGGAVKKQRQLSRRVPTGAAGHASVGAVNRRSLQPAPETSGWQCRRREYWGSYSRGCCR